MSETQPDLPFRLTGSQKKTAFALRHNCEEMCREAGIERMGFLTLTVGDETPSGFRRVSDSEEASRRINNLNRRVLPSIFVKAAIVTERHASGDIHFHVFGILREQFGDIRTGFDFEAVKRGDYRSASPALRAMWKHLREVLPPYGFGRAELKPARKSAEAVSSYIAKYIEKNLFNRLADDRKKKLVRYLGWNKTQLKPNEFGWNTPGAASWRIKARTLAKLVTLDQPEQMRVILGPRWAYAVSQIMPSMEGEDAGRFEWCRELMLREAERMTRSRTYLEDRLVYQQLTLSRTRGKKTDPQRYLWN